MHLKETSKLNSGGEHTSMTQLHIATSALFLYYYYYFWSGGLEWDRRFGAVLLITHSGTGRHGEVSFFHVPKRRKALEYGEEEEERVGGSLASMSPYVDGWMGWNMVMRRALNGDDGRTRVQLESKVGVYCFAVLMVVGNHQRSTSDARL